MHVSKDGKVKRAMVIFKSNGFCDLIICDNDKCISDPENDIDRYRGYEFAKKAGWKPIGENMWICPECSKKKK